ncbi:EF-hand [Rhizoclosmatium globosum]|uniref:Calcineurin subunit B n=1 Tax=Rhizoclosmatium globosum TaxID=329046 RepID=A0A1Y2CEJ5_9FUNG|nr:Calcineurin subunit B type 2 [Rhizoclosmatium sp. JEL0117]ORY45469.1 EF-hand [Rhizoclosmatium globosum]|eukprot:ORY45469.1 EF-hand [Rhizoclosmatium globosum]
MGAASSTASLSPEELQELEQMTGLPKPSIARLYSRFHQLDKNKVGSISANEMIAIPEFAMNPLAYRMISVFDSEGNNEISFRQFLGWLSVFSKGASREQKLEFAFRVYDVDADGIISFDDLQTILKLMVGKTLSQKEIEDLVRETIWQADTIDKDGAISFDEFKRSLFSADFEQSFSIDF